MSFQTIRFFQKKPALPFKWLVLFWAMIGLSCSHLQKPERFSVRFLGEQVFEKNKSFEGLPVGGLSEIFFDRASEGLVALSDDKKAHRFYLLKLKTEPCCRVEIQDQVFLKDMGHKRLQREMDPEALVFLGNKLLIASEGQQIFKIHEPTQIFTFDRLGRLKEAWPVPPVFWKAGKTPQPADFGQQENQGFESLTLDEARGQIWTATETPLRQDLIFQKKSFLRLSAFDIASKKMLAQYAYILHNSRDSDLTGLTALQFLKSKMFISLERSYKKRNNNGINSAYLFLTDCRKADNVAPQIQLRKKFKACEKTMLWDSTRSSVRVDNLEGIALAPAISTSHWTKSPAKGESSAGHLTGSKQKSLLVLVSDNNFNEEKQKTQFLFFELIFGR